VATLPPMMSTPSKALSRFSRRAVAVGRVDDDHVDPRLEQTRGTLPGVAEEPDGGSDAQAAGRVLGGVGILLALVEVLDGDEPGEASLLVDDRQLLDLVLGEDRDGVIGIDALASCDERRLGHDVANQGGGLLEGRDESHVAVRDDAHEHPGLVDDRQPGHAEVTAERVDLGDGRVCRGRDGIGDHARLAALDQVDLARLIGDGEVAVQDAEAALSGHGDGHARLGHGVHRGAQ
jgi:hypothetical protein